jgi:hypothetical protein
MIIIIIIISAASQACLALYNLAEIQLVKGINLLSSLVLEKGNCFGDRTV